MSYEAWGDDDQNDYGFREEKVAEIATEAFTLGLQYCREMMARFVEQGGDQAMAKSIRANWNPAFGDDPGKIPDEQYEQIRNGFDYGICIK